MKVLHTALDKIRKEASKIHDVKTLKKELVRVGQDLMKIDLTAEARKRVDAVEKSYHSLQKNLEQTQKHVEKELAKAQKVLHVLREDLEKALKKAKSSAAKSAKTSKGARGRRSSSATATTRRRPANANNR